MTSPYELLALFQHQHVNESEFEQVLTSYFGGAQQVDSTDVIYPGSETSYALKLVYNDDTIAQIEAGPALKTEDLTALMQRVEEELIASIGIRIGAVVLFAKVPITGTFRYSDVFQLLPVPQDAPRPSFLIGDHPFLLEFSFAASSHWPLNISRRAVIGRELELFLAGAVEGGISSMGFNAKHHWVMTSETVDPLTIGYRQEMYTYPGIQLQRETFSPIDGIASMTQADPSAYYARLGIGPDQRLELPNSFSIMFQTFGRLSVADRRRFLTSCFWFQHATQVHGQSRSASFTALISAIEALVIPEGGQPQCSTCGRSLGPGPTERFAQFLETFAPGAGEMRRERKRLYGIRSALSHGGSLLR